MPKKQRSRNFILSPSGTVKIRWYRSSDGRTFIDPRRYGRKLFARADHDQALREARHLALEIQTGGTEALALTAAQRAEFAKIAEITAKHRTDPLHAITQWDRAVSAIGELPLDAVIQAGFAALAKETHPVSKIVEQLLATAGAGTQDKRTRKQRENMLRAFAAAHPIAIEHVTPAQVETFLAGRRHPRTGAALSPKRRNHWRAAIVQLFKHARDRGHLPDVKTAAQKVSRDTTRRRLVCGIFEPKEYRSMRARGLKVAGIFTPQDIETILLHADEADRPWLAINAFSGARVEEIGRSRLARADKDWLRWEDFDWTCVKDPKAWHVGEIVIRAEVSKTGHLRRIPISRNLAAWLAPWRRKLASGLIVPEHTIDACRSRVKRRLAALGSVSDTFRGRVLDWPENAMRHSYGSYRMAILQNLPTLAYEMGNSIGMVQSHYHNPRPRDEGEAWFGVAPHTGQTLIQLDFEKLRRA